jgi:hypothetical protein
LFDGERLFRKLLLLTASLDILSMHAFWVRSFFLL